MQKRKKEKWVPIKGYEGFYEISNHGRVRSIDRIVYFKNGKGQREYKGKILKQKYHNGYAMVNLNKNKELKVFYIHRLVAEHFIPRIKDKNIVNHKNGIKSDNYYKNLEWCTSKKNNIHVNNNGLHKNNISGLIKYTNSFKKQVIAIKDNRILTIKDCSRDMAIFLLEHDYIKNVQINTASRSIRKSATENKPYHNIYFSYNN